MAGTYFEFKCTGKQRPLLKFLLRKAQNLASTRYCKLKYKWDENHYHIDIDGSLYNLQALIIIFFTSLIPFAEGLSLSYKLSQKKSIAERLCLSYHQCIEKFSFHTQAFTDIFGTVPNSFMFFSGKATHLQGRLRDYSYSLLMYRIGRIKPNQVAEESHSIAIFILNSLFPKKKNKSFAGLVILAHQQGIIDLESNNVLLELKGFRKNIKHRGQTISFKYLDARIDSIVRSIHALIKPLRR